MSRHLSPTTMEMFAARQLAPKELLEAARHMAICEECRANLGETQRLRTGAQFIRDDLRRESLSHLNYEQLEGYVNESLDAVERDIITNHLAYCETCTTEVEELRRLRDSLSIYPNKTEPEPAAPHWWQKLAALFA